VTKTTRPLHRVAVIGGGISGLAAAHRLVEIDPTVDLKLFESSNELGGVLKTNGRDDYLIEQSADMFITRDPWALELCKRIGFDDQLIPTNKQHRKAFVVRRGRLVEIPSGFTLMSPSRIWPVLTTPLLSWSGKLRLAREYLKAAKKDDADESLKSFVTRRFGRQAYERLIQPLIGGIYTADPEKLSMRATMRQFVEMEREHGSLIRGMKRRQKTQLADSSATGARYDLFVTPRDGMSSFVQGVAAKLPPESIQLNSQVTSLAQTGEGSWQLEVNGEPSSFDGVIVATRATHAAELLRPVKSILAEDIATIPYAGASVVVLGYRKDQFPRPPEGSGFVVPLIEQRQILAVSFSSNKFPGRAPDNRLLIRVFVGGACQPELAKLEDDQLFEMVQRELAELLGAQGQPEFKDVVRWLGAMPQYHVGHLDLVERIEQQTRELPHLELAGNAYRGVGIPFCVCSGEQAAERLLNRVERASD
jgi:oxygen-dependent protoporphyrinogen oxidase